MREKFKQLITETECKLLFRNSSCKSSSNSNSNSSEQSTSPISRSI